MTSIFYEQDILIIKCARCGENHIVKFKKFKRPINNWTHWGICPVEKEPILMQIDGHAEDDATKRIMSLESEITLLQKTIRNILDAAWNGPIDADHPARNNAVNVLTKKEIDV
jgi:hypothetical protein